MPQPDNLVKLDMVFTLGTSAGVQDSAEFGIWGQFNFTPASGDAWDAALAELAQYAADQWSSGITNTRYSNGCGLLHARTARCNTSGHTVNEQIKAPADSWTGNNVSGSLPWGVSLCVGLYTYAPGTFVAHAANRRGRVYLPPLNFGILTDDKSGEPALSLVEGLRDDFGDWLKAIGSHDLAESEQIWTPGVLSTTRKTEPGYTGSWLPVTFLKVDNKMDTQRRRERQQLAVSSSVAFPSA